MSTTPDAPKPTRTVAYDNEGFFRVEHQHVPHKDKPYEFVKRIGAVTILPIVGATTATPLALQVKNERYHYGTSIGLPGGNVDGGLDNPETPLATALRELREETGFGFADNVPPRVTIFRLRNPSNVIDYPRFLAIAHDVTFIGGQQDSEHEHVTPMPIPLTEYVAPLFRLERGETYPELNAAFAKAGLELGQAAVMEWLINPQAENTAAIANSFNPWLFLEHSAAS